jgi:hypothetical protein
MAQIKTENESLDEKVQVEGWVDSITDDAVRFCFYDEKHELGMAKMPLEEYKRHGLIGYELERFDIMVTGDAGIKLMAKPDADEAYKRHLAKLDEEKKEEPQPPKDWDDPKQVEAHRKAMGEKYKGILAHKQ